jgi:uncharacterized membrane protein YraQ (UPF0718 family)
MEQLQGRGYRVPAFALTSGVAKKRLVGLVLMAVILGLFFTFNRLPKLDIVGGDLDAVSGPVVECFQGFCIERDPDSSFVSRWVDFSVTYLRLVTIGMTFAFLMAGLAEAFLFPPGSRLWSGGGVIGRTLKGAALGPVMNLCSACIVPVSSALKRSGAGIEGTIALVQGSSTMNIPALSMSALIFAPLLGGSRVAMSVFGALAIGPAVAWIARRDSEHAEEEASEAAKELQDMVMGEDLAQPWGEAMREGFREFARSSVSYFVRLGPIMAAAGFVSGLVIQFIDPDKVGTLVGNDVGGVLIAATLGILINVPLMFEIPLVALLLLLGMGVAPAAALLFAAAAGGPVTFWGLSRIMPKKAMAGFISLTWLVAVAGGLIVLVAALSFPSVNWGFRPTDDATEYRAAERTDGPLWQALEEESLVPTE